VEVVRIGCLAALVNVTVPVMAGPGGGGPVAGRFGLASRCARCGGTWRRPGSSGARPRRATPASAAPLPIAGLLESSAADAGALPRGFWPLTIPGP
jgi:hypothetical protein